MGRKTRRRLCDTGAPPSLRPLFGELLEDRCLLAIDLELLKDINTHPNPQIGAEIRAPVTEWNGLAVFVANDGVSGRELWKSDGTASGTVRIKDIQPGPEGSDPSNVTNVGGTLFFWANDGTAGVELWKSDGTESGTILVKDIDSSPYNNGLKVASIQGSLFFTKYDGQFSFSLWRSDGTTSGTVSVRSFTTGGLNGDPNSLTDFNGMLFFAANDGVSGMELWKSDGTPLGTERVKDIRSGPYSAAPSDFTIVGSTLFFLCASSDQSYGLQLWKSDGTETGTEFVKSVGDPWAATLPLRSYDFTNVNGTLFFRGNGDSNGLRAGYELWRSDGTATGTVLVKDIFPSSYVQVNSSDPRYLTNLNGTLFFAAIDGVSGRELWRSDGTAGGTVRVKDIQPGVGFGLGSPFGEGGPGFVPLNGTLFFVGNDGTSGFELWRSDGTSAGTVRVKEITPASNIGSQYAPALLSQAGGRLFFAANDGITGIELWTSSGTESGTTLVKDIRPGASIPSYPLELTNVNGTLFFRANSGISNPDWGLWMSDGTAIGTVRIKDVSPFGLSNVAGSLFFSTGNNELWKSDGTDSGTRLVKDFGSGFLSTSWIESANVSGTFYFVGQDASTGRELWKSDGTTSGTVLVKDIQVGSASSAPVRLTNVGGTLYFAANDGTNGSELWKSDGTATGTVLVKDLSVGYISSNPSSLLNTSGTLYFQAGFGTNRIGLWKSDGTATGTVLIKDLPPSAFGPQPPHLTNVSGSVYFVTNVTAFEQELWKSDGTTTGTQRVTTTRFEGVKFLTNVNGLLFFTPRIAGGVFSYELWKSDGTASGTVVVKDIVPGAGAGPAPKSLTNIAGTLFFTAQTNATGREIWRSDGTESGTVLVEDVAPGMSSSADLTEMLGIYDRLLVPLSVEQYGKEIWTAVLDKSTVDADFNDDGFLNLTDLDVLIAAIASGTNLRDFDLSNDRLVNLTDRDLWLTQAGAQNLGPGRAYRLGDANLDGVVDGSDFGSWNSNKFTAVAAWSRGDFNADGFVDGSDFGIWNGNKFTTSDGMELLVPLPAASATRVDAAFQETEESVDPWCDREERDPWIGCHVDPDGWIVRTD